MRVVAIDPGPVKSGYCVLCDGVIEDVGVMENNALRLHLFFSGDRQGTDIIAIEWCSGYGMKVGNETFETCRWEARFEEAAFVSDCGFKPLHVRRRDVKSHLCDNPTTNDKFVRQALIDKFGAPGTAKNPGPTYGITGDAWAALAVAAYALDKLQGGA